MRYIIAYRKAIESRGSGDLSPVNVNGLPTEILATAESVNNLLERLRRALEAERSFTANSAHELRTPIALAQKQLRRRFVRANTSVQGSGLGLAIADAIATGIGASMTFNSPASGRK